MLYRGCNQVTPHHPTPSPPVIFSAPSVWLPPLSSLLPITVASCGLRPTRGPPLPPCPPTWNCGPCHLCAPTTACTRCRGWSQSCSRYCCCRFGAPFIGDDGRRRMAQGGVSAASRWGIGFGHFREERKLRGRRDAVGRWPMWPHCVVYKKNNQ
jgi:hypothetical protein